MLSESLLNTLRANQRFLVQELQNRGIDVSVLDWENELLEARLESHSEIFFDIDSSVMPYVTSVVAGSKSITKRLLSRAGLAVPEGQHFSITEVSAILDYADQSLGYPVVVKPSVGMQGKDVHTGLTCKAEVEAALYSIQEQRGSCEVLAERQVSGKEYRLFITKQGRYAALHRDPAHVIGNGCDSIEVLAERESSRRLNPRNNCLGAIVLDDEASRYLRKQGLSFATIPADREKVYVRGSSNVMMGGVPEDVTDVIHPDFVSIGLRALKAANALPYAGIDLITEDISKKPSYQNYSILELNSVPGIGIHMAPGKGPSRNVAELIVDLVFPESCANRQRQLAA